MNYGKQSVNTWSVHLFTVGTKQRQYKQCLLTLACTKVSLCVNNPHDDVLDAHMALYDAFIVFFNMDVQIKLITAGTGGVKVKNELHTNF